MLKSFRSLPFLFTLIPFPGFSATDYELAQRLIGQWSLTYTIPQFEAEPKSYRHDYALSEIKEDPLHPGTYQVWGTNQFGEPMIAQYDFEKQEYRLTFAPNPTDPILYSEYKYYTFTFTSAQTVIGCYYKPNSLTEHEDGTITPDYDKCASLTGTVQTLVVHPTQRPIAHFTVTPNEGYGPLTIQLDGASSFDPDGGEIVNYKWKIYTLVLGLFACDASVLTLTGAQASFTLAAHCSAEIELRVTDDEGFVSTTHQGKKGDSVKIMAFESPHNQFSQVPGTPNYQIERPQFTMIFWRERQADGTYFPFLRLIPKVPPPPPFIDPLSQAPFLSGKGPSFCGFDVEQQGKIYESMVLKVSTQADPFFEFCESLMEPATFFLAWDIKENFNDTRAFSIPLGDNNRLEIPAVAEGQPPVAHFTMTQSSGYAPVTVTLDASTALDPDGQIIKYTWEIQTRRRQPLFGQRVTTEFEPSTEAFRGEMSNYEITLTVVDNLGLKDSSTQTLRILEPPPQVSLVTSQTEYHQGEQVRIQMPASSKRASYLDNYVEYVGIILPQGAIYSLTHQNLLLPFDGTALSPWQGGEQVIDLPVTSEIPRGHYQLYLVLVPKGIEPLSFRQYWGRGITPFTVLD